MLKKIKNLNKSTTSNIHFTAKRIAIRDLKSEFRNSFLGVTWLFITPIVNTILWLSISQSGLLNNQLTTENLGLYIFSGTLLWQCFVEALNSPFTQINNNKSILSKINFHREALLLAGIYRNGINNLIRCLTLILTISLVSIESDKIDVILTVILAFTITIICGFAIGLLLLPFIFLFSDLNRLLQYGIQLWMYVSPVVFIKPKQGILNEIFNYNFMSIPLNLVREAFYQGINQSNLSILFFSFAILILSALGLLVFRITMPIIIERMSN